MLTLFIDITDRNVLYQINNFDSWTESQVYQILGVPQTEPLEPRSHSTSMQYAPATITEGIRFEDFDQGRLTGKVYLIDFGQSFFCFDPPLDLGMPLHFYPPELQFGFKPSTACDIWGLGCILYQIQASMFLGLAMYNHMHGHLSTLVSRLGPFPPEWEPYYENQDSIKPPGPGKKWVWFDKDTEPEYSIESCVQSRWPQFSALERDMFLELLRCIVQYYPSQRYSARQIAAHPWFS